MLGSQTDEPNPGRITILRFWQHILSSMATHLTINTSSDWPKTEQAHIYISGWAHKVKKYLDTNQEDFDFKTCEGNALGYARKQSGFECVAAILITMDHTMPPEKRVKRLYAFAAFFEDCNNFNDPVKVAAFLELLEDGTDQAFLADNLIWVHTRSTPFEFDVFAYRNATPRITVIKEEAESGDGEYNQKRFEASYKMAKSASQRAAFKTALEIVAASKLGLKGLGVALRRNMLICGPSGSGKSWVCNRIAHFLNMQFVTVTLSSWHLRGGSGSERPSCEIIFEAAERGAACIVVDEVDKFRQTDTDNKNYFRSAVDELMGLMDGRVQIMTCSSKAARNLRKSIFIGCGAFQDLYRKKLGEVSFAEEIEAMPPLTIEDIRQSGWLSEELTNRFCTDLLEIRPPSVAETTEHMQRILAVIGTQMSAKAVNARAEEIVKSMQSIRGIEKFAMDCARARVRQDVDIIKNGGF